MDDENSENVENKIDEISNIKRVHCYAELAKYFQNLQEQSNTNNMNTVYSNTENDPLEKQDANISETKTRRCPAKTHLNQCSCHLELELAGKN